MEKEDITSETLPDEAELTSPDEEEAVDDVTDDSEELSGDEQDAADALSLEELNSHLGKNFKDKESALKALKDTFKYVGKAGQLEKELKTVKDKAKNKKGDYITKEQYDTDMFYKDNPQYNEMRGTIDRIARADGITPSEVVETDEFKGLYEKVVGYDESQKAKSVLESNPRIGQASSKVKQSKQALQKQDFDGARNTAVEAVLETMTE